MPGIAPLPGAALAALLVAVLVAVPATSAAPIVASSSGLVSYNTGRVNVILPEALPSVELFQDANSSVRASLEVQEVLELAPGALPHPRVVAAAFPNAVSGFNGTVSSADQNASGWPITLSASLDVRRQNASLWSPSISLAPVGGRVGAATLSIQYEPLDNGSAGAGVGVAWTVQDWPWVSSDDLLAVELALTISPSAALTICTGDHPVGLVLSPCYGSALGSAQISWGSSFDGLEGASSAGPVAAISWNSTTATTSVPYTVGAYATGNGSAQLVLGAAGGGATEISGGVGFALVAPLVPVLGPLTADAPAYIATLVVSTLAVLAAIIGYRRRERRIREEL